MKRKPKQGTLDLLGRGIKIPVRVNEEEKARFDRLAKARHTNLSELIRQMLHAEADKLEKEKREAA